MGPTPTDKQIIGIVLILGAALVAIPLKDTHYIALLVCGAISGIGLVLLVKGGRRT